MSYYTPTEIANQFVAAFFEHLHKDPDTLHQFYSDESCFSRVKSGEKSGDENSVVGFLKIREEIASHAYQNCKVAIDTVDAQLSTNGVIVMVTGIILEDGAPRDFCQTFFLQEDQVSNPPRYFIRNDVLRYLKPYGEDEVQQLAEPVSFKSEVMEEEADAEVTAPVVAPASPPVAAPVEVAPEPERKQRRSKKGKGVASAPVQEPAPVEVVEVKEEVAEEEAAPADVQEEEPVHVEESIVEEPVPVPVSVAAPVEPKKQPRGWKPIVQPTRVSIASPPVAAATASAPAAAPASSGSSAASSSVSSSAATTGRWKKTTPVPVAAVPLVSEPNRELPRNWATTFFRNKMLEPAPPTVTVPASAASTGGVQRTRPAVTTGATGTTSAPSTDPEIFLSGLIAGTTEKDVLVAFSSFGEPVVRMVPERNFCFVRFSEAATVDTVLAAAAEQPLTVKGAEVSVERRKSPSFTSNRAPRTPRAPTRGAFRGARGGTRGAPRREEDTGDAATAGNANADAPSSATTANDGQWNEAKPRQRPKRVAPSSAAAAPAEPAAAEQVNAAEDASAEGGAFHVVTRRARPPKPAAPRGGGAPRGARRGGRGAASGAPLPAAN